MSAPLERYRSLVHELSSLLTTYDDSPWSVEVRRWAEDIDYVTSSGRRYLLDKIINANGDNLFGMGRISDLVLVPGTDPRLPRDPAIVQAINKRIGVLCIEIADAGSALLEELDKESKSSPGATPRSDGSLV